MSSSLKNTISSVFSNRNVLALSLSYSIWAGCSSGWRPYWSLYLKNNLGASITVVGMLSMIQLLPQILFQLPGGILADKYGRKKVIIYGSIPRLVVPVIYLLAPNWIYVIPALLIESVRSSYKAAQNAMLADSLPQEQRGAAYGAYKMITSLPGIFMPVFGGIVMDALGYKEGIRVFLIAQFLVIILSIIIKVMFLTETLGKEHKRRSIQMKITDSFNVPKTIWFMILVSMLSGFATMMVMPFVNIYAIEIIGLTNTQLGFVQTSMSLLSTIFVMPGAMLSDHFGRKPMILISDAIKPFALWGITLARSFPHYFLIQFINTIGTCFGGEGGGFEAVGGPAWEAMIADTIPREKRATVKGLIGTIAGIIRSPSSWVGGYIWQNYIPQFPFQVSLVLGLIAVCIFTLFVKEPKKKED